MIRKHTTAIRRGFILGVVAAMFGFALVYPHTGTDGVTQVQAQPNIVVVMVDDMRADDLAAMPKTTSLLETRWVNSYATLPLCCPSRATFLTGQYAHNHGVEQNGGAESGGVDGVKAFDDSSTWATWLNPGYRTVMLGKYLNQYGREPTVGPQYIPPGWDSWAAFTDAWQYRDFHVTTGSNPGTEATNDGTHKLVENVYQSTWLGNRAVTQIRNHAAGEPMAMWVSFFAPHAAPTPSKSQHFVPTEAKYDGDSKAGLPSSEAFDEVNVGDKPGWIEKMPRLSADEKNRILTHRRERREALMSVDDQVARIVAELKASGEWSNTVLLFTSDNGFLQGEHRVQHKMWPYWESVKVPLLTHGLGDAGPRFGAVANIDTAATIAAAAGVPVPESVDGLPLQQGRPSDRPVVIENPLGSNKTGMAGYHGIVRGRDMYVEYVNGRKELYPADDLDQLTNRIASPDHAALRAEMAALLAVGRDCAGVTCRTLGR